MRRKQIDQYKLGEMLGVGTVGTVYEAVDQTTGQRVALKLLQQAVSEDKNIAARFRREMDILSRLNHPNIVRYLGDGKLGKQLYYTMELVTGGSVKEELQIHHRLPWRKVCEWGAQIASALQHAHNHGIIHRDLKPANLFLTTDGKLKLGDFGIARDTGSADLTDAGLTVGTYAYMAPEQITAEDPVSDKTDLYALGCLLFEMLTGRQPYLGANFAQIFNQHLQGAAPRVRSLVPECPASLDAMIRDLMEKDPEQRPFNARFVQGFLKDLLENPPQTTPEPSRLPAVATGVHAATDQWAQSRDVSWTMLFGLTALLALIVLAAWALGR